MSEQAVIINFSLSEEYGERGERESLFVLADEIDAAISLADVGEVDGNEFGNGEATVYMYGPDAGELFSVIEPILRRATPRPISALLRYGDVDDYSCREETVYF